MDVYFTLDWCRPSFWDTRFSANLCSNCIKFYFMLLTRFLHVFLIFYPNFSAEFMVARVVL